MLLRRLSENRFESKDVAKVFYASLLHTGWTDQAELERSEWGGLLHAAAAASGPQLAFNISPFTPVYIWSKRGPPGGFRICHQWPQLSFNIFPLKAFGNTFRLDSYGSTTNRRCRKKVKTIRHLPIDPSVHIYGQNGGFRLCCCCHKLPQLAFNIFPLKAFWNTFLLDSYWKWLPSNEQILEVQRTDAVAKKDKTIRHLQYS